MVDLFIICFLIVCIGWDLPQGHLFHHLARRFSIVVDYVGLRHSWRLFAPNPPTSSYKLVGLITLRDGRVMRWGGRFSEKLSWWESWLLARHRKWETSLLHYTEDELRLGYCAFLVSRYRKAGLDPIRVEIGKEVVKIPHPEDEAAWTGEPERTLLCTYDVATGSLVSNEDSSSSTLSVKKAA